VHGGSAAEAAGPGPPPPASGEEHGARDDREDRQSARTALRTARV
jgi:hypothetical protein